MFHDCPYLPDGLKSLHDSKRFYNMMDINGVEKVQKTPKKTSRISKTQKAIVTPKPEVSDRQKRLNAYLQREKERSQQLLQKAKVIKLNQQENDVQDENDHTFNNYKMPVYQYTDHNNSDNMIVMKQANRNTITPIPKYNTGRLTPAFTPSSISTLKNKQNTEKGDLQQTPLLTPYQQQLQRNKILNDNKYNPQSKQNTGHIFNNIETHNLQQELQYNQNTKDVQTSFAEQYYYQSRQPYFDNSEYMLVEDIDGLSFSSNGLNSTLIYSNNRFFDKQDVPILTCTKSKSALSSPNRKSILICPQPQTDDREEVKVSYHSPKLSKSQHNQDDIIMNISKRNAQVISSRVNLPQSQHQRLEQADASDSPAVMIDSSQYREYNKIYSIDNPVLRQISQANAQYEQDRQNVQVYDVVNAQQQEQQFYNGYNRNNMYQLYQQSNLNLSDLMLHDHIMHQKGQTQSAQFNIKNMKFLMIIPENMNTTFLKVFEKLNLIDYLIDNQQKFVTNDLLVQMQDPQEKMLFIWQHKTVVTDHMLNMLKQNQAIANNYLINHYYNIEKLTNKRNFYQLVKYFKSPLIPKTYSLPSEYKVLCRDKSIRHYIIKASGLSRGRGITLAHHPLEINYKYASIAQEYIDNPLLIKGRKCDFRLYTILDSERRCHLYTGDGICRISPNIYSIQDDRIETHITNTSVSKQFQHDSRMSVQNFLKTQEDSFVNSFWNSARQCVQLLVKMVKRDNSIENVNSFELLGFDMLLTERFKPYLIEVNASPSLVCDCQMDLDVKIPMLAETLLLLEGSKNPNKWELIL